MASSPLAAALLGGNENAAMFGLDPAVMQALPDIQLGQAMQRGSLSTDPASPWQAAARMAQAAAGGYLQRSGTSDLAKAYAGSADSMTKIFPAGTPIGDSLRSDNPMVRMTAMQQAGKAMLLGTEPRTTSPGQVVTQGSTPMYANPNPQSPEGKLARDQTVYSGNPTTPLGAAYAKAGQEAAGAAPYKAAGSTVVNGVERPISEAELAGLRGQPTPLQPAVATTPPVNPAFRSPSAPVKSQDRVGDNNTYGKTPEFEANVEGQKKLFGGASEALGKVIGESVEAGGKNARDRINALNSIENALKSGGSGVTTGPYADTVLKAKEALDSVGVDTSFVKKGLPESEVISKMNAQLASASAKAMTGRPTQFEFASWMKNNPGLLTSKQGTLALIDILKQAANQDIAIGRLGQNKANWEKWGDVVDDYYKKNPLISPFTKKPMDESAAVPNAAATAGAAKPPLVKQNGVTFKLMPDGNYQPVP